MKRLALLLIAFPLSGCLAKAVVDTAVTAVTLPVKAASGAVDLATTSQAEADQKRGRKEREAEEKRGRELREMEKRCHKGKPLPSDDCATVALR